MIGRRSARADRGPVRRDVAGSAAFGVDRLSLSFPVASMSEDPEDWPLVSVAQQGTVGERWSRGRMFTAADPVTGEAGKVTVYVGVTDVAGKPWAKVETNPSRFVDPSGCGLLPLAQLEPAVNVLAATAQLLCKPAEPVRHWRVKRVDLARDFRGIGEPWFYVQGLLHVHRPYARRQYIYSDPGKGNAQTLWAGGKAGGARLYDQHEAYAEKGAPEGSLRWEVEARGGSKSWLDSCGIRSAADLVSEADALYRLAETRWEWSGMGREIASVSATVDALRHWVEPRTGKPLSEAKRKRLLGDLLEEACGVRAPASSPNAESEYRRMKRDLGFAMVPAIDQLVAAGNVRGRLDWESGTEVAA